jgi:hypothetical protein
MGAPLRLTTGDIWGDEAVCPTAAPDPVPAELSLRRRRAYIGRFVERMPPLRAIRAKCASCMGGDADRMPRGDVAQAIDECSSTGCPLWPFRYAADPWRPEATVKQRATGRGSIAKARARLKTRQTASAENTDGAPTGTQVHPAPAALAGAANTGAA